VYRPMVYTRPVVDVTVRPPAFQGTIIAGGPGVHARGYVGGPVVHAGVSVAVPPPPSVHVGVHGGGPGVQERGLVGRPADAPRPRTVYTPAPSRTVVTPAPAPRGVIMPGHHDNGRHEGWNKHGH